jgi:hypothetical protein
MLHSLGRAWEQRNAQFGKLFGREKLQVPLIAFGHF